jgi:hypothetical protein
LKYKPRNFQEKKTRKNRENREKIKKQDKNREKFYKIEKNFWGKNIRDLIFEKKNDKFPRKKNREKKQKKT